MRIRFDDTSIEEVTNIEFFKGRSNENADYSLYIGIDGELAGEIELGCFETLQAAEKYATSILDKMMVDGYLDLRKEEMIVIY